MQENISFDGKDEAWLLGYKAEIKEKLAVLGQEEGHVAIEQFAFQENWQAAAVLKREDRYGVLVALNERVHLENFTQTFVFATDSVSNQQFLLHFFPNVEAVLVLDTLDEKAWQLLTIGRIDGFFSQYCVIKRLGWGQHIVQKLNIFACLPPVGAATLLLRAEKPPLQAQLRAFFHDAPTFYCLQAEAAFSQCFSKEVPFAAFAFATLFQGTLSLSAGCVDATKGLWVQDKKEGRKEEAEKIGIALAHTILKNIV